MQKIERWFFYPVLILETLFALQAWSDQALVVALPFSLAVATLWALPLISGAFACRAQRALFWTLAGALIALFLLSLIHWGM